MIVAIVIIVPMVMTLVGIVTDIRFVHSEKAEAPNNRNRVRKSR